MRCSTGQKQSSAASVACIGHVKIARACASGSVSNTRATSRRFIGAMLAEVALRGATARRPAQKSGLAMRSGGRAAAARSVVLLDGRAFAGRTIGDPDFLVLHHHGAAVGQLHLDAVMHLDSLAVLIDHSAR